MHAFLENYILDSFELVVCIYEQLQILSLIFGRVHLVWKFCNVLFWAFCQHLQDPQFC
jgi:hypothetical protein